MASAAIFSIADRTRIGLVHYDGGGHLAQSAARHVPGSAGVTVHRTRILGFSRVGRHEPVGSPASPCISATTLTAADDCSAVDWRCSGDFGEHPHSNGWRPSFRNDYAWAVQL